MKPGARPIAADEIGTLFSSFGDRAGVVLAVSGGADSTALMVLASRWRLAGGATPLFVATVDHGLRDGSRADCDAVLDHAARLGLPARCLQWLGEKPGTRIQERAREARYGLLADAALASGADTIATAHTLHDQAETVMMRLARGSGPDGLAAMRARTPRGPLLHLRPLLATPRARLVATLVEAGAPWIEDPSNQDPRFERTRIRRLAAMLAPAGLDAGRLGRLAARAGRAADALDAMACTAFGAMSAGSGAELRLDGGLWLLEPGEIRLRVLRLALEAARGVGRAYPLRLERLEALSDAVTLALSRAMPLRRTIGGLVVHVDRGGTVTFAAEKPRRRGQGVYLS